MNISSREYFQVNFQGRILYADSLYGCKGHILMIHGGSKDREAGLRYRHLLAEMGFGTTAFDCIGHGETGGLLSDSSLASRTAQAEAVARYLGARLTGCLGVSMGAYNALKLSEVIPLRSLVLMVPGVYHPAAYQVNFGPEFSSIIRRLRSWEETDAWRMLSGYEGKLLVIAAAEDQVIPAEIPQKLYASAPVQINKALLTIPNADHHSVWRQLQNSQALYNQTCRLLMDCLSPE